MGGSRRAATWRFLGTEVEALSLLVFAVGSCTARLPCPPSPCGVQHGEISSLTSIEKTQQKSVGLATLDS